MKILQVGSALPNVGGIEKFILNNSRGLRDRGHEVHMTAIQDSWLYRMAQAHGFQVHAIHVRRQHDFSALAPYVRLYRSVKFDIVNTHYSADYLMPAIAARLTRQRDLVMTRHLVRSWSRLKSRMFGVVLYDRIIAVSEATRQALLRGGISSERVVTVHVGVERPEPPPAPAPLITELGLRGDAVLIGIVSRITQEKGHAVLVKAMMSVPPEGICLIIGKGKEEKAVQELVASLKLEQRVHFLAWRNDIMNVIAALDVMVLPSLWEEACSQAIIEAMALGKPVVATHSGGNGELIEEGLTGLLAPKQDENALGAALTRLVCSPELRRQMGEAAAARQERLFTLPIMAQATEQAYAALLTARRP